MQQKTTPPQKRNKAIDALKKAKEAYGAEQFQKAEKFCKEALKGLPDEVAVLNMMGLVYINQKKWPQAEKALQKIIALHPDDAIAWKNLALTKDSMGKFAEAEELYLKAAQYDHDKAAVFKGLYMYHRQNRIDEALVMYRRSIEAGGQDIETMYNIGLLEQQNNNHEAAAAALLAVLRQKPDHDLAMSHLSLTLKAMDRDYEAIDMSIQALAHNPDSTMHQCVFVQNLKLTGFDHFHEGVYHALHYCLTQSRVSFFECFVAWRSLLLHGTQFGSFAALMNAPDSSVFDGLFDTLYGAGLLTSVLNDSFLCLGMKQTIIADPLFELGFVRLRRKILLTYAAKGAQGVAPLTPFMAAFGEMSFFNEYVFDVTDEEERILSALRSQCRKGDALTAEGAASLALLACYEQISSLENAQKIEHGVMGQDAQSLSAEQLALQALVTLVVSEPRIEREFAKTMPTLSPIADDVSRKVREMYEENPYPRWRSISMYDYYAIEDQKIGLVDKDMLVAGCGTGRHAIFVALKYPGARITALDLSLASLSYAKRKVEEYDIKGMSFIQGDILEAAKLGRQYDHIECLGVLHHMHDPMAGWRVLTGLLKPGGTMRIGLYSELARESVVRMRNVIADKGFASDVKGIREGRRYVMFSDDQSVKDLLPSRDFYTTSMCRDLLYHVQEHRFTLPQIKQCLAELGLDFLGIEFDRARHLLAYQRRNSEDRNFSDMDALYAYEQDDHEVFRGMYRFELRKPL